MGLNQTVVPAYIGSSSAANQLIRDWRLTKKHTPAVQSFLPGNFVFTNYVAITPGVYDINPVVMVLRVNRKYVFGINVNWLSRMEKKKLLDFLIKNKLHKKSRISRISLMRSVRRFGFTRKAYRLYFKKELRTPRVFNLTAWDFYNALSRNLRTTEIVKK